jgi:hypothetical protein
MRLLEALQSAIVSKLALPPTAAVLIVSVCSVANRGR